VYLAQVPNPIADAILAQLPPDLAASLNAPEVRGYVDSAVAKVTPYAVPIAALVVKQAAVDAASKYGAYALAVAGVALAWLWTRHVGRRGRR
jgi:hypothetical protein